MVSCLGYATEQFLRRRRMPSPTNPPPIKDMLAGSGTVSYVTVTVPLSEPVAPKVNAGPAPACFCPPAAKPPNAISNVNGVEPVPVKLLNRVEDILVTAVVEMFEPGKSWPVVFAIAIPENPVALSASITVSDGTVGKVNDTLPLRLPLLNVRLVSPLFDVSKNQSRRSSGLSQSRSTPLRSPG